jgi:hypothetical protein
VLIRSIIVFAIVSLIEIYFLQAVKTFSQDFSPQKRNVVLYIAYGLAILSIGLGITSLFYPPPNWNGFLRFILSAVMILLVCKLLGCFFLIIDDVIRLFRWIFSLFTGNSAEVADGANKIGRLKFMSQIAITFTIIPAIGFIYGMVRGAYRYRVHRVQVPSKNLPDAFHGFKIVQVSDIHTGSFMDNSALSKALIL